MRKKIVFGFAIAIVLVIFVPLIIAQITAEEPRKYRSVRLSELDYTEISFRNQTQNLDLAGMLFAPKGEGRFPAVVIIHGSGTSRRDSNWYLTLASFLQASGVAVLLPDKRGSEKSEGDWRTSSFEDLATDTLAALDFMKKQRIVEISRIGVIGMSQGGWIAPIVASRSPDLDFVVNMVGTSVTTHEQLQYEENLNLREIGFLPGVSNLIAKLSTFILRNFSQKDFWDAVGDFDPTPYWKKTSVPVLVLYGSEDTNVPSAESKTRFESLSKDNIEVKIYEGSGHGLQDPVGTGDRYIREDALKDIRNFISSGS